MSENPRHRGLMKAAVREALVVSLNLPRVCRSVPNQLGSEPKAVFLKLGPQN